MFRSGYPGIDQRMQIPICSRIRKKYEENHFSDQLLCLPHEKTASLKQFFGSALVICGSRYRSGYSADPDPDSG
jgi:hypothetical protein